MNWIRSILKAVLLCIQIPRQTLAEPAYEQSDRIDLWHDTGSRSHQAVERLLIKRQYVTPDIQCAPSRTGESYAALTLLPKSLGLQFRDRIEVEEGKTNGRVAAY